MKIAIIDYGAGNVQSVLFALERLGFKGIVTNDWNTIKKADNVIFPGVGEASSAMKMLVDSGLDVLIPTLKQPVLGICLGMQMSIIEYSRTILGYKDANSTEMNENTTYPVVNLMEDQKTVTDKGGTMRLGAWKCDIKPDSLAHKIYGKTQISERHRHRYEYNSTYVDELQKAGLIASGVNPDTGLVEIVEIENHPFFIGVQYHPEYKSTVANPHPIFVSFVAAAVKAKKK